MTVDALQVSDVRFKAAPSRDVRTGLVGWISCAVNQALRLDGLVLRRTLEGRLTLSFPARRDSTGRQRFFVRPLDDRARREIEQQIFRALALEPEVKA